MCWKSSVQSRKNQPRIKSSKRPQAPVLTCARKMIITRGGGASMPKSVSSNPHIPTSRSSFMFNQPSRRRTGMFPLKYWAFKILLFASRTVQYTIWLISNFGSSHAPHAEQARRVLTEITIKFWVREPRVDWVTNWVKKSHCTSSSINGPSAVMAWNFYMDMNWCKQAGGFWTFIIYWCEMCRYTNMYAPCSSWTQNCK